MKKLNFIFLTVVSFFILSCQVIASDIPTPSGYYNYDFQKMVKFLELEDENGVKNGSKLSNNYSPYNPETWGKNGNSYNDNNVDWVKDETGLKRICWIYFNTYGSNAKVAGELDVNGFTSLEHLQCTCTNISDLNLGYAPNLKYLYCGSSLISELDLSGVPNLEYLGCSSTAISNLDLSSVPKLIQLECGYTNISKLDLSNLKNLGELQIDGTQITEIDLNKVPNLYWFVCSNTSISQLDLSNLPNLDYLTCFNTPISQLDLSKLTSLEKLACNETLISELDLKYVPNLKLLYCYNSKISTLDLDRVPKLQDLACSYCKLSINELKKIKSNYNHIYKNDFENQNIFDDYIFTKGDIKSFGNETSTYKWFNGDKLIENINTSEFDFSNYIGKKVRCEITDGDITLKSNSPTVIGVEFDNPPESLYKGTETKLLAKLNTFDIEEIEDTSVSWSINDADNYSSNISEDGILKVSPDETFDCITVRATSNFNPNEYQEVKILIKTNPKSELQNAIDNANKINNKDNATIDELLKAIWDLSNAIIKYHK